MDRVSRLASSLFIVFCTLFAQVSLAAIVPAPPQLAAKSYLLMDARSGEIIVRNNEHLQLPPASLTKMLTAYIVEEELAKGRLTLKDTSRISEKAWKMGGSKMFIKVDTDVSIEDLLRGVIIQSGNDASVALAEHVAGSEEVFADVMNQYAGRLGMENSSFVNATGWPAKGHLTTAHDMAILARAIIYDHPEFYPIYAEKHFTYPKTGNNKIKQSNRNRLLWRDPSVDGLKTGHTEEAGYCLVSSAKQEDMRLIAVVMGAASDEARAQESQKLLTYGFRYFQSRELYKAATSLSEARVWAGAADKLDLGLAEDLVLTIPRGDENKLNAALNIEPVIEAPIKTGDVLGNLVVTLNNEVLVEKPLVALHDVEQAGFFSRMTDYVSLFFYNLFN